MKLSTVARLVFCLLVLSGIALPEVASACTGICQVVAPPFCRRCMDAGYETGVACRDSGSCGCFYIQCAPAAQAAQPATQANLAELGLGAPMLAPAACEPALTSGE